MRIIHAPNFVEAAAELIVEQARKSIEATGSFRLGLSGGNTPGAVYSKLAESYANFPWDRVVFTFGDERQVPSDDAMSNYRTAQECLLSRVNVQQKNVLRFQTELGLEAAARACEEQLRNLAGASNEAIYRHDLLLLGLGGDGHTASLFPGSPVLEETTRWIGLQHLAPPPVTERLTFTFPLINASRHICFLAVDPSKTQVIDEVIAGDPKHPASRVRPTDGELTWLLGF